MSDKPKPIIVFIVAVGNAIEDGYTFYGPFDDSDDARDWAEPEARHDEWHVAEMELQTSLQMPERKEDEDEGDNTP